MDNKQQKTIINTIKDNWVILAFIISVVVTWTNFLNADAQAEAKLNALSATVALQSDAQMKIFTQLAQIQTDLAWIKDRLK